MDVYNAEQTMDAVSVMGITEPQHSWSHSKFILSRDQQQRIKEIIARYKDAPFDQHTYIRMQNDMETAGLSPERLALEEEEYSFNPSRYFLMLLIELHHA